MGSRNIFIWPAAKTVALVHILCSLALFLLPLVCHAKTFVFTPTKQPAYYSDTANWVNRDYPGTIMAIEDSILFESSIGMNEATIDSNVYFLGTCIIGKGMKWYVPLGINVTIGRESYTQSNYQYFSTGIIAEDSSLVQIWGYILLRKHGVFKGLVTVSGSIYSQSPACCDCGFMYCEPIIRLTFNELEISGIFGGSVTQLSSRRLIVQNTGSLRLWAGWEPITSNLAGFYIINSGKIELFDGVGISGDTILNKIGGDIKAGAISGVLKNAGAVYIWGIEDMNGKAGDLRNLENSGSIYIRGIPSNPVVINGAINHGSINLYEVEQLNGIVYNYANWGMGSDVGSCGLTTYINANFNNYGNFGVGRASIILSQGEFKNYPGGTVNFNSFNYSCSNTIEVRENFFNWGICNVTGHTKIFSDYFNWGVFNGKGILDIYGTFSNYNIITFDQQLF